MEDQMAEVQRKYNAQLREYDEMVSSKDDVGKSVHDLEKVTIGHSLYIVDVVAVCCSQDAVGISKAP